MQSPITLVQRTCVIAFIGVLVGGAHAVLTSKPIKLKPAEVTTVLPLPAPAAGDASAATSAAAKASSSQAAGSQAPSAPAAGRVLGLEILHTDAIELAKLGAIFIDARHRDEYEQGHVADAYLLPADEFYKSGGRPDVLNYFPDTNSLLVIYCGGGACDASHNVARLLQEVGYTRTHIMKDGYPAWRDAGQPVSSGKPAYE